MKSFDTDIKKYTEKIRLKASERRELRERIFAYMEYHPLKKEAFDGREFVTDSTVAEPFITLHFNAFYARIVSGIALLLLIVVSFVAEKAVPGDVLYLVKTGINETIQGQLANSPYEKIEFETKLMERRIAEARVLATEGKLTDEAKTQIAETVKEHTVAVQKGLTELREQNADEAALAEIAFNSSLEVQSAVLDAEKGSTDDTALIESIITVVGEAREEVASNQEESTPSYDGLIARVELETTRAHELFTTAKRSATDEEIADIDRRLSDINRLTSEAKQKYEKNPDVSKSDITSALGLIQKLITFMTDIDVRETVTLESLVPVVLSDEERIAIVRGEIDTLGTVLMQEVTARTPLLEDAGVREKVEGGLASVTELLLKSNIALEASDISGAEHTVREARALMTDLDVLTQPAEETEVHETNTGEEVVPPKEETSTEGEVSESENSTTTPETISVVTGDEVFEV